LGSDLGSESIVAFSLIDSENLICPLWGNEFDSLSALSSTNEYLNPNRTQFVYFSDDVSVKKADRTIHRTRLVDLFHNISIYLVIENDASTDAEILQAVFCRDVTIGKKIWTRDDLKGLPFLPSSIAIFPSTW
jgi:hypothetical protein